MSLPSPQLPTRFPCWVKAVYSWGGETKKDLGFIEGDLIECLNAGDGSWWTGRLKRDRRMIGLFPSNFVEVLPESFQTQMANRNASPLPPHLQTASRTSSNASSNAGSTRGKSVFRKPFQAYQEVGAGNKSTGTLTPPKEKSSGSKFRPYSSMKIAQAPGSRAVSPAPKPDTGLTMTPVPRASQLNHSRVPSPAPQQISRAPSPQPLMHQSSMSRAHSPAPMMHQSSMSRAHSPAALMHQSSMSRAHSPMPYQHEQYYPQDQYQDQDEGSPPPPPPPPHRNLYAQQDDICEGSAYDSGYGTQEAHSPIPASPGRAAITPSPLRDAMNGVMESLQDMGFDEQQQPEEPGTPDIWSPEAFDQLHEQNRARIRANTAHDFTHARHEDSYSTHQNADLEEDDGPPNQVQDYVARMERRLQQLHEDGLDKAPLPPLKDHHVSKRHSVMPTTTQNQGFSLGRSVSKRLKNRKSAIDLGKDVLSRTFTTKTNISHAQSTTSTSTQMTHHSLMSGHSAGAFSATSAGSLARRKFGWGGSIKGRPMSSMSQRPKTAMDAFNRSHTPVSNFSGPSYHDSHSSENSASVVQQGWQEPGGGLLGGMSAPSTPKHKKSGFLKKMIESAKTGAASARSTIGAQGSSSRPQSRAQSMLPPGVQSIAGGMASRPVSRSAAMDMGLGGGAGGSTSSIDWVQIRRDVNRSNSLSKNERIERAERCTMMDIPVIAPVEVLEQHREGDEGMDGQPVEQPTDFLTATNLDLVDKSARFVNSLPPGVNATGLAQAYLCRPYRSDVQRLRAIFTWVAERVSWEEDFDGPTDTRRVIHERRGCSEEIATLVFDLCTAIGVQAEVVQGYLKQPGERINLEAAERPNHWWNAMLVDSEWRIMDCSLASPTNPKRSQYSSAGSSVAETWWFLTSPSEICYTHVPYHAEQQHMVPSLPHDVLMALPVVCPPFFRNNLHLSDYDTAMITMEELEMAQIRINVPLDIECTAEVEARTLARDFDGDYFESGDMTHKTALAQPDWANGVKSYTIKAVLPGDEGQAVLKVYAGKKGLMHSIRNNPHRLAFAVPLTHTGKNPAYDFVVRHPTPHALRHDLYIAQPQCARLAVNNTFVFAVRQHPANPGGGGIPGSKREVETRGPSRAASPNPYARPTSAMSMVSGIMSQAGSNYSHNSSEASNSSRSQYSGSNSSGGGSGSSGSGKEKPAKLAIQSPSGKIIRLSKKDAVRNLSSPTFSAEGSLASLNGEGMGGTWETVIKIGERGTWRGLVLADRTARWCVFAEWECS